MWFVNIFFFNVIICYFRVVLEFGYAAHSGVARSAGDSINI